MSLPADYDIIRQSDGTYAVEHAHHGLLEDGFEYRSTAEDWAADHAAEVAEMERFALPDEIAAELAELVEIETAINARGGYVSPNDAVGQARARAIDLVLAAIDNLKAERAAA